MTHGPGIVLFGLDLRLDDQPALHAAVERGKPVLPVHILSPEEEGAWPPGAASRWWLHRSLAALDASLRQRGSRLVLRRGPVGDALDALIRETGADVVFRCRRIEPALIARDAAVERRMRERGVVVETFNAGLLYEPEAVLTKQGKPYQVYTPYLKACLARDVEPPLPAPGSIPSPAMLPESVPLDSLGLEPTIDWAAGLRAAWVPGEQGARRRLERFLDETVDDYAVERDRPDLDGTSSLSPHLHFGEIGPRRIRQALLARGNGAGPEVHLKELIWREFAHHLLFHFPHTTDEPLRSGFAKFPWRRAPGAIRRWQEGRTGYPIVDAGMRQLWETGWMHNRVRMIAASFLVKDLLVSWREGARWFWDTLVDADLANNSLGWQWTAGCGADAAPWFRIFNPVLQGRRFDPQGHYVSRWIPEIARLPMRWIHQPWAAPASVLREARVKLGRDYPRPMVDHDSARARALATLRNLGRAETCD